MSVGSRKNMLKLVWCWLLTWVTLRLLKMEVILSFETSVNPYRTTERHSSKDGNFCLHQIQDCKAVVRTTVRKGADKSLAFPVSYFLVSSATKRIFLGWVKEVRKKIISLWNSGGICRVNTFFQSHRLFSLWNTNIRNPHYSKRNAFR
jgi:hypothetical protein